jgi:hypothetical protein
MCHNRADAKDDFMPKWKFWEQPAEATTEPEAPVTSRFGLRPRTDLQAASGSDPAQHAQLERLLKRRELVSFDVEQAELALAETNPWLERIALIDEALQQTAVDLERERSTRDQPGEPFPPLSVSGYEISSDEPVSVSFRVAEIEFRFEEEQDWAERGFQLARGDLIAIDGDPGALLAGESASTQRDARAEFLAAALFVFASDLRDRALQGEALPSDLTLQDLAKPDRDHGGWLDWKGHSAAAARKEHALRELKAEHDRLLTSRAQELEDLAKWEDRLPIARRRLAEVDAEIAALGG